MGAMSGIQQAMMAALQSAAANLPPEIQENILQIGQKVAMFQAQLDRIEQQNADIIRLLSTTGKPNGTAHAIDDQSGGDVARLSGPSGA
jgi:hypothetical protein